MLIALSRLYLIRPYAVSCVHISSVSYGGRVRLIVYKIKLMYSCISALILRPFLLVVE